MIILIFAPLLHQTPRHLGPEPTRSAWNSSTFYTPQMLLFPDLQESHDNRVHCEVASSGFQNLRACVNALVMCPLGQ